MNIPQDMLYTKEHEWVRIEEDDAVIGITEHAAHQLGDIVFVELPEIGDSLTQTEEFGVVESVKTVSPLFAPVSGEVIELNKFLLQEIDGEDNEDFHPEYVNEEPHGKGWMVKVRISDKDQLANLLSPDDYAKLLKEVK